jgi:hypothetical protein
MGPRDVWGEVGRQGSMSMIVANVISLDDVESLLDVLAGRGE